MEHNNYQLKCIVFLIVAAIGISGCKQNGVVEPIPIGQTSYEDAAETIAAAVGDTTGGVIDILGDITQFATVEGPLFSTAVYTDSTKINDTTWLQLHNWTGTIIRTKGTPADSFYSSSTRIYEWQFLKDTIVYKNNDPAQPLTVHLVKENYTTGIAGRDTARTISISILGGATYTFTPQYRHRMSSITGTLLISKANYDTITIDGAITINACDTLLTRTILRTLTNQIDLPFANYRIRRGIRTVILTTAYTIKGSYAGVVAFPQGSQQYADVTFRRNFLVKLDAGTINIGGARYQSNLLLGTLN